MNQIYVVQETFVCTTPVSFVAEVGSFVMNGAGDCRKREDGLMGNKVVFCPGELDFAPACVTDFLYDAR